MYLKPKIVGDDNFYYCLYVYAGLYQHQGNESTFEEMVTLYEQEKRPEIKKLAAEEVLYLWSLTKLHELMTARGSKHDVQEAYEPEPEPELEPEPEAAIEAEDTQSERPEILERKRKDLSVLRKGVSLLERTNLDALSATTKQQILTVVQYLKVNFSHVEDDQEVLQRDHETYQGLIEKLSTELAGATSPSECQKAHETWLKTGIAEYIAKQHPGIAITEDGIIFELDKEGFSLDIGVELESTSEEAIRYCIELDGKHHEDNYFQVLSDRFRDEYLKENSWHVIRIKNREINQAVREGRNFTALMTARQQDPKRKQKEHPKQSQTTMPVGGNGICKATKTKSRRRRGARNKKS